MLGSGETQEAGLYRRYAALLYREALATRGDPAPAEHAAGDALVNERALAVIPKQVRSVRAGAAAAVYLRHVAAFFRRVRWRTEGGRYVRDRRVGRER